MMSDEARSPIDEVGGEQRTLGVKVAILATLALLTLGAGVAAREIVDRDPAAAAATDPSPLEISAVSGGPVHFSGQLDRGSVKQAGDGLVKLELSIRADDDEGVARTRTSTDLVVVLDRSGSMQGPPIAHALAAVHKLIDALAPGDRFALVSYANHATLDIPITPLHDGIQSRWVARLNAVRAGGNTNMSSGLDLAAGEVEANRARGRSARVILVSDGHANEGDASFEGLRRRVARAVQGEYVVSSVGVGEGFDEHLMVALADAGTGNFYYVERADDLGDVFAGEFASARDSVASALEVRFRTRPGIEVVNAAGYPLARSGDVVRFNPGALFAGQERRIWVTLRVPTTELGRRQLGDVSLAYRATDGRRERLELDAAFEVACVATDTEYFANVDREAWERSVADDDYSLMKFEVAHELQLGRADEARARVQRYVESAGIENAVMMSPEVAAQISEAEGFAAQLESALNAPAREQSRFSKKVTADAYDGRRVGAKKSPSPRPAPVSKSDPDTPNADTEEK